MRVLDTFEVMSRLMGHPAWNIPPMFVTWLVSNEDKSPLNEEAPLNIYPMVVTRLVSNEDKSSLNEEAPQNILYMFQTRLVSQPLRSSLNVLYVEQYAPPSFQSE